jgi:hypothetical protein
MVAVCDRPCWNGAHAFSDNKHGAGLEAGVSRDIPIEIFHGWTVETSANFAMCYELDGSSKQEASPSLFQRDCVSTFTFFYNSRLVGFIPPDYESGVPKPIFVHICA